MAGETFQLRFRNNEDTYLSIDEPINFATVDFQLSQKDKGYGRDVSFNGGETQFEFVKYRNHYLDKLLLYNNTYGFESIVELIITCGTVTTIIGELDFATAITDDLEYFKCKVIQQSSKQVIKRRKAVKVDLLGSKDIDGNYLAPLVPENILLYSKPIYKVSTWSQGIKSGDNISPNTVTNAYLPSFYLNKYEVTDSYVPIYESGNYKLITSKGKFQNLDVKISNLKIFASKCTNVNIKIIAKYGVSLATSTSVTIYESGVLNAAYLSLTINAEGLIPTIKINESIWINMQIYHQYSEVVNFSFDKMNISISAENITYNSVVPAFRLIDVMKKVSKSISGSLSTSNRFETGGEFYNNFIFNGNSLRVIPDKPFYVSLEDLEKSIIEMNADWEIKPNGDIFFGIEDDFYTNIECGAFSNTQFSQINKSFNPRFSINKFNYGYKNFQSLKENEEANSADVIHGESEWSIGNKSVENKKDISIEWTRDSFLIESNRRKSLEITEGTSSQDDTDLFIIDTLPNYIESTSMFYEPILSHSYTDGILTLSSTGDINFKVAGMRIGDVFLILSPSVNIGTYIILSVENSSLGLVLTTGSTPAGYTVPSITYFEHRLKSSNTPYVIATTGSFTEIDNLIGSSAFANLKYSIRRNIELYWKKYLTTCNLYHNYEGISNTWYKNNTDFTGKNGGIKLTEKEVIDTYGIYPLLTPFIYNDVIFSNVEFSDFIALQDKIRTDRGYILTKDINGVDLKLYPISIKYDNLSKELTIIKGEEKFNTSIVYPQLTPNLLTLPASDVSFSSSKVKVFIKSNGGNAVTEKGMVYNTSTAPTISTSISVLNEGNGSCEFTSSLVFLEPLKTYYARAYAQNGIGLVYGNEISFTTLGETQIGSQVWTLKNLNVSTYRDGTPIPQVPVADWNSLSTGAWCYYDNDVNNGAIYGKLYNWYAVNNTANGGLAPNGYHVPVLAEANKLVSFLGGSSVAGGRMKEIGTTHWITPNTGASNSSNFYALPSGLTFNGDFLFKGTRNLTWINTSYDTNSAYFLRLINTSAAVTQGFDFKQTGGSVRLIKD